MDNDRFYFICDHRAIGCTERQRWTGRRFDWHKARPSFSISILGIDAAKSLSGPPYGQDFIYMISNRFPDVSER
jgi:hypothetical protein